LIQLQINFVTNNHCFRQIYIYSMLKSKNNEKIINIIYLKLLH